MDFNDIAKAQNLQNEKQAIQNATTIFDTGGTIVSMGVAPKPVEMPGNVIPMPRFPSITVPTEYIQYPPQMVDGIKAAFAARLTAINDELRQLGVTGIPTAQAHQEVEHQQPKSKK